MNNKSVWQDSAVLPQFQSLKGDAKTDVLIIGGGICGLLCAYYLKKSGIDCIVAEGGKIASGITKNTTAKITSQHGLVCSNILNHMDTEKAKMYLKANQNALKEYEKLCKNIDCDFEKRDSYIYSVTSKDKIKKEFELAKKLGIDAEIYFNMELPFKIKAGVKFNNQAQFNPIKFISHIAKDLNIYENTFIKDVKNNVAISENGRIEANKIIVATHFPFINTHGSYFLKMYQHRSYVVAFENVPTLDGVYCDEDIRGMSFRSYNALLLVGGGSHRTGKNGGGWDEILKKMKKYYPKAKPCYMWATQDCMSLDGIPYIGKYSKNTPDMYVATGFNKWGFTSSMVSAKILCDMIKDSKNEYEEIFSPQRSIIKPQLFVNGFESAINLISPTAKRCPHLGCALKWNKYEHSWDCPCHGSRFERDGKLIDNPATKDANCKNS